MKLFARVKEIYPSRTGVSQRTGNQWTAWPVVFEDNQGENTIMADIFRDKLPEDIHQGAEGWLIYTMNVFAASNGNLYNQVRFVRFDNVQSTTHTEKPQGTAQIPTSEPRIVSEGIITPPFQENAPKLPF